MNDEILDAENSAIEEEVEEEKPEVSRFEYKPKFELPNLPKTWKEPFRSMAEEYLKSNEPKSYSIVDGSVVDDLSEYGNGEDLIIYGWNTSSRGNKVFQFVQNLKGYSIKVNRKASKSGGLVILSK
jgi:hypothetical protein